MNWNIDDIPLFIATVEHKGVSAAAAHLQLAKSTVSKGLNRLEQALGLRLLERNSRNIRITAEGETFYRHCLQIMQQVEETEAAMSGLQAEPGGRLVVALPMAFGREIVARHLPRFRRQFPKIELEIIITSHPVDIIRDQIDLAVVIGELADSELIATPLYQSRLLWVTTPAYRDSHELGSSTEALQGHIQICEQRYRHSRFPVRQAESRKTINLSRGIIHVNDPIAVREALLNGGGVSLLPDQYCKPCLASGELVEVYPEVQFEASAAVLSAVYPQRRLMSKNCRVFLEFLRELCEQI
ncbi:LysR family transcriptional regulator [Neptuniibacter halophilus]|uniref:LysR family transcriptional regulator n=1 Tax=Neptuniibacter halophilus TaxID=651666 RepID=UPI002573D3E6|nr:LysR family transcriptional regulator [Neptuniibacter halophilus]